MNTVPIIQSVERALKILDLFDEYDTELRITDISERLLLHKSTVHSLLKTLRKHQYIEQNPDNGKYRLGLKLFERGNYVIRTLDLRTIAKDHLIELSRNTGRTVHLVILDGKEGVYIDKVEGPASMVLYSRIGRRVPIHSSGVGKALASFQSDDELENILIDYDFIQQTPKTISSKEQFLKEVETIREKGYAIDYEENEPGVCCVAMPIRDHTEKVIAAVSISTTVTQFAEEQLEKTVSALQKTTDQISKELGYRYLPVK